MMTATAARHTARHVAGKKSVRYNHDRVIMDGFEDATVSGDFGF
jgi:hypothetical protein